MQKFLSKSGVTTIPGIGTKYAERLKSIGVRTVGIHINWEKISFEHLLSYFVVFYCTANGFGVALQTYEQ